MEVNMNMRDYLIFILKTQNKVKEQSLYCCSTFYSHSRFFNNEHNWYPKLSEKHHLACR